MLSPELTKLTLPCARGPIDGVDRLHSSLRQEAEPRTKGVARGPLGRFHWTEIGDRGTPYDGSHFPLRH